MVFMDFEWFSFDFWETQKQNEHKAYTPGILLKFQYFRTQKHTPMDFIEIFNIFRTQKHTPMDFIEISIFFAHKSTPLP